MSDSASDASRASRVMDSVRRLLATRLDLPLVALVALAAGAVYFPVTRVFFYADDFSLLVGFDNRGLWHWILRPVGGHLYVFRSVMLYLPHRLFGFEAAPYGWLALGTHVLNVVLLYRVLRALTGSRALAALGGGVWGTALVHAGAVGWFAAYGYLLSGTALLVALSWLVSHDGARSGRTAAIIVAVLWMGATSCGVGIGIALAFPFAVLLLGSAYRERGVQVAFASLPLLVVATYFGARWAFTHAYGLLPAEDRLGFYVVSVAMRPIIEMWALLFKVGSAGLLLSFALVPETGPPTEVWWPLLFFLLTVALGLVAGPSSTRRSLSGLLLLAAAAYGIIALGRANFAAESLASIENNARVSRYHYVSTLPMTAALVLALREAARLARAPRMMPAAALAVWTAAALYLRARQTWRIDERDACRASVGSALAEIDAAIDAKPPASEAVIPNKPVDMCFHYPNVADSAGLFVLHYPENEVRGRRVRFLPNSDEQRDLFVHPRNRRLSPLLAGAPSQPANEPGSSPQHACAELWPVYERIRLKRGCARNWQCDSFFAHPACQTRAERVMACVGARPEADWRCDADGRLDLEVDSPACREAFKALVPCMLTGT